MQKWEEKILDWEKGKSEGLSQGLTQGRSEGKTEGKALSVIELLEELGEVPEALRVQILAQADSETLSVWLKMAAALWCLMSTEKIWRSCNFLSVVPFRLFCAP